MVKKALDEDSDYDENADGDFVPDVDEADSTDSESGDEDASAAAPAAAAEPVLSKSEVDDIWASFNAALAPAPAPAPKPCAAVAKANPPDASDSKGPKELPGCSAEKPRPEPTNSALDALLAPAAPAAPETTTTTYKFAGEIITETIPVAAAPGNTRKRRPGVLDTLSASMKPKKLNTIEKSKLDWNKYVAETELTDDLAQARRSKDGYLEKQEFLQRAGDRREEIYEEVKDKLGRRK